VRERRGRGRVGEVVGGDVDGLDRRNRALLGGGNALLQLAHLGCQRGLVADGGRHTAKKCRDLGARLREAEDVVDEEQDVLALVTEVLGGGEAGESDTQTCSGRLVHLAVDQAGLVDDARLAHLEVEVGALTGTLANAGEHGRAAVLLRQVVDELLDQDGLADACAAEEARLAAADIRLEKVDGLDAGLEDLGLGGQLVEGGRGTVDRVVRDVLRHGLAVDRLAHDIPDAAERRGPTGIIMGGRCPWLCSPRCRPSVDDMATVRTTSPASWDSTSSTVWTLPMGVSPSTMRAV
jgi:peptide chain release factor 1